MKTAITLYIPDEFSVLCSEWDLKEEAVLQEYVNSLSLLSVLIHKMGRNTTHRVALQVCRTLETSAALAFIATMKAPYVFLDSPRRLLHERNIAALLQIHLSNASAKMKDHYHNMRISSWHKQIPLT